ncbi:MAG: DUF3857 and transglutaminase domain-containing protein, partial [Phaeodactylibacter sp.]|nr:DUF3857 and transglutaminase domain-containing protein [Phaeodactylibacter sp.]
SGTMHVGDEVAITIHERFKILDESALHLASRKFYYWGSRRMRSFKAQTINRDPATGEVRIDEVPKDEVYTVDVSGETRAKSVAFPNVQVGSILEYTYTLESEYYTSLEDWVFQDANLPTLYSSLEFHCADWLYYSILTLGKNLNTKYADAKENKKWALTNIRSFKDEPFVNNYLDYADQVQFQLTAYKQGRYGELVKVLEEWDAIARRIREYYQPYFRKDKEAERLLESLTLPEAQSEKVEAIYKAVQQRIAWNGRYRVLYDKDIDETLEIGEGNSADINLFIIQLLREAGIEAHPILISTRSSGKVLMSYPIISQFNHVIVAVKNGEGFQLVDGISKDLPLSLLPLEDYNYYGLLIQDKEATWLTFPEPGAAGVTYLVDLDLTNPEQITGRIACKYEEYEAFFGRQAWKEEGMKSLLGEQLETDVLNLRLQNPDVRYLDDPTKAFIVEADLYQEENPLFESEFLYIDPDIMGQFEENPFKSPQRDFPIELPFPTVKRIIYKLKLPEHLEVEDIPESTSFLLLEGAGQFVTSYRLSDDNLLDIRATQKLNSAYFKPEQYAELRTFYQQITDQMQEMAVFKARED